MAADRLPFIVAKTNVQVGAINTDGSYQADNFKMTAAFAALRLVRKPDGIIRQVTDCRGHPQRFNTFLSHEHLDPFLQVFPGFQAKNIYS